MVSGATGLERSLAEKLEMDLASSPASAVSCSDRVLGQWEEIVQQPPKGVCLLGSGGDGEKTEWVHSL